MLSKVILSAGQNVGQAVEPFTEGLEKVQMHRVGRPAVLFESPVFGDDILPDISRLIFQRRKRFPLTIVSEGRFAIVYPVSQGKTPDQISTSEPDFPVIM